MVRQIMQSGLITGILVMGCLSPVYAAKQDAGGRGIVLTVTALDAQTDMATLQTQHGGKTFQLAALASWKVGDKVECDLIPMDRGPQLQNCQPWQ